MPSSKKKYARRIVLINALIYTGVLSIVLTGCRGNETKNAGLRYEINASDSEQLRALEGTGIYTDGWVSDVADIALLNPEHRKTLLISGVNVQTGLKDERIQLRITYPSGKSDSVMIERTGSFELPILIPMEDSKRDTLEATLTSSKIFVPSKLGTSKDDRTLSFRLVKIGFAGSEVSVHFPGSYEFPRKEESDSLLRGVSKDGWIGDSAVVTLYNTEGKKSVEIRGFVPTEIFQKISNLQVLVRGTQLVNIQLPRQNRGYFRSIVELPDEMANSSNVAITLKPSGTFIPAERGTSPDKRRLSYRLEYIGLK